MNSAVIEESLEKFEAWIDEQAELPKNLDKLLLLRYLKASEFNLERAKFLLTNGLKWRQRYPNIFTQRDPLSKEMRSVIEIVWVVKS